MKTFTVLPRLPGVQFVISEEVDREGRPCWIAIPTVLGGYTSIQVATHIDDRAALVEEAAKYYEEAKADGTLEVYDVDYWRARH